MKKYLLLIALAVFITNNSEAQEVMTPELLWKLGRVNPVGITKDGQSVIYSVTKFNVTENKKSSTTYIQPINGGNALEISKFDSLLNDKNISPDGKYMLMSEAVKIKKITGKDLYPDLNQSNAYVFDQLHYRHWDHWEDGMYSHVKFAELNPDGTTKNPTDIMTDEPYDCPQKPFGGDEDYIWSPDSKFILYVSKKKFGTDYAKSTNTDIYIYSLKDKQTYNLTEGMKGYDTHPLFSPVGVMSWLSMSRDGNEADKNDIFITKEKDKINLTADWDGTVDSYIWSKDGKMIYFLAAVKGTKQLFELTIPATKNDKVSIKQITDGQFDINAIIGQSGDKLVLTRTDMNHANEIYVLDLKSKDLKQLSKINDDIYKSIKLCKVEKRIVKTTDNKDMLVWVVYPPDFDENKKYPALLYCQGGPQSALTQFYSFRWNLQLMASQGYIIVAPNRRGMPGHGVKWNEDISTDWGGQCMNDYLSAIDDVSKEKYVDKNRLGCVGASFGGYSAYYLAGKHQGRFKSFIAHCGIFNLESMYGTTEEIFFSNWDMGGAYWDANNSKAQKTYKDFNPINFVDKWDSPILIIHGGKDYRVPYSQGMEAFQAAQLKGIKSRFLYLPDENHWVSSAQNALVWQREYFRWLAETLK
jgi:dipeptidyl aminopeptidase/acylaminoacyl peptidase